MKKSIKLILVVLLLGVLLLLLWFTSSNQSKKVNTTEDTSTTALEEEKNENDTSTTVLELNADEVQSIEIIQDGETLNYISNDKHWNLQGYEDLTLQQTGIDYNASVLLNVNATRTIKDAVCSEYGIDKPTKKAIYHLKDGSTTCLLVGTLSLDQSSVYVAIESDPSTVYLVPNTIYKCMVTDLDTYRNKTLENYDPTGIASLEISGSEFENISLKLSDEQNGYFKNYDLVTDTLTDVLANSNSVEKLTGALPSFTVSQFVADHVTDLSTYGLDQPILHIKASYYDPNAQTDASATDDPDNKSEINIIGEVDYIWGNTLDSGEIAFMKVGDSSVYSMDASFLNDLKQYAKPFYLVSKYLAMPNIKDVSTIDVTIEDMVFQLTMDEENKKYTLCGNDMEEQTFKKLYRHICSLSADIELKEKSTDTTPLFTITYYLLDGTKQTVTLIASTDSQYYECQLANALTVGVTKNKIEKLKETIFAACDGKEFDDIY